MAKLGTSTVYGDLTVTGKIHGEMADLAEVFQSEYNLEVGTVVEISSDNSSEVRPSSKNFNNNVIGVVSEKPAYIMNSASNGYPIGLVGRVPVLIKGRINKGDIIVASKNGVARKGHFWEYFWKIGISMENKSKKEVDLVKCFIYK